MNKTAVFLLGVLTGGAAAGTATYFISRNYYLNHFMDVIDQYAQDCQDKINSIVDYYEGNPVEEEEDEGDEEPSSVEPDIANNEGVKKYHHYAGGFGEESAQKVFSKVKKAEEEDVTEGEKALVADASTDDIFGIDEITEDEFLDAPDDKIQEYLNYDFNTDKLYWGYNTDNEEEAEKHFGKGREELIGKVWRWATDYIKDDSGVGAAYVRNSNLGIDFEILMRYDSTQPVVEVSR